MITPDNLSASRAFNDSRKQKVSKEYQKFYDAFSVERDPIGGLQTISYKDQ
jgi:hypothetical protein